MATKKKRVESVKVGELIGTPGDRKVRTHWGCVDRIERDGALIRFYSRDWVSENDRKKYGATEGSYRALKGETVLVREGPAADRCRRR